MTTDFGKCPLCGSPLKLATTGSFFGFIKEPMVRTEKGYKIYRYVCTNPRCGFTCERAKPSGWF